VVPNDVVVDELVVDVVVSDDCSLHKMMCELSLPDECE
jgi:hypothetical protein